MGDRARLMVKFLNVGQGDATHVVLPDGQHMLIDCNRDAGNGGIDVCKYLGDELPHGSDRPVLAFLVNTHPHDDHVRGMGDIGDAFEIGELWHSGHERDLEEGENPEYDRFREIVDEMGDAAIVVTASSEPWAEIGDVTIHAFRPSSHVRADDDLSDEERRKAIHDECMVLKISYGDRAVILTGDSSRSAWETVVTHYEAQLDAEVLSASHHGSRSFFKETEDDDPFEDHLDAIDPQVVVISVGTKNEHDHPHDDALELYEADDRTIYRTDEDFSVFLTIYDDGEMEWSVGDEAFQERYQLPDPDEDEPDDGGGKSGRTRGYTPRAAVTTIGGGRYA